MSVCLSVCLFVSPYLCFVCLSLPLLLLLVLLPLPISRTVCLLVCLSVFLACRRASCCVLLAQLLVPFWGSSRHGFALNGTGSITHTPTLPGGHPETLTPDGVRRVIVTPSSGSRVDFQYTDATTSIHVPVCLSPYPIPERHPSPGSSPSPTRQPAIHHVEWLFSAEQGSRNTSPELLESLERRVYLP